MVTLVNLDHIVLNTYDKLDDMLEFYCQILTCQIEREVQDFDLIQLRAGNAIIDLQQTTHTLVQHNPIDNNVQHFCLTIEEPIDDKLINKLLSQNISTSNVNTNYGAQGFGASVYIEDPCGNTVELKQHQCN